MVKTMAVNYATGILYLLKKSPLLPGGYGDYLGAIAACMFWRFYRDKARSILKNNLPEIKQPVHRSIQAWLRRYLARMLSSFGYR